LRRLFSYWSAVRLWAAAGQLTAGFATTTLPDAPRADVGLHLRRNGHRLYGELRPLNAAAGSIGRLVTVVITVPTGQDLSSI